MDDYYDLGAYKRTVTTTSPEAQTLVRPRPQLALRLQPCRGDQVLRQGTGARSRAAPWRIGASPMPPARTTICPGTATIRPARQTALAASYDAMQGALAAARHASPVEQALIRALPARYPQREAIEDQTALGQGLHHRDAQALPGASRRSRPPLGLRRIDHERDAVADVGPHDRQADAGRRHGGGGRGAGERLPRHAGELGPSRPAAPLCPSDGDVAVPAAGAARRRPAARPRAGLRPSGAHADPYRRAVRQLPRRRRL